MLTPNTAMGITWQMEQSVYVKINTTLSTILKRRYTKKAQAKVINPWDKYHKQPYYWRYFYFQDCFLFFWSWLQRRNKTHFYDSFPQIQREKSTIQWRLESYQDMGQSRVRRCYVNRFQATRYGQYRGPPIGKLKYKILWTYCSNPIAFWYKGANIWFLWGNYDQIYYPVFLINWAVRAHFVYKQKLLEQY